MPKKKGRHSLNRGVERVGERRFLVRARGVGPSGREVSRVKTVEIGEEVIDVWEAARQARDDLARTIREPPRPASQPDRLTVGAYAPLWLKLRAARVRRSTADRYMQSLELHILPDLGDRYVDELVGDDVEEWLVRASASVVPGSDPPRRVSAATVNGWLRVLLQLLRAAAARLRITSPGAGVRPLPEPEEREGLTADEVRAILAVATAEAEKRRTTKPGHGRPRRDPAMHPMLAVAVLTGMRWGEVSALRWEDIDLQGATIQLRRAHWHGVIGPTKAKRERTIPIAPEIVEVLRTWREDQVREQRPGVGDGWVFATRGKGDRAGKRKVKLRSQSSMRAALEAWAAAAGVGRALGPQAMRRTFVDLARLAGIDPLVRQALVGHAGERVHGRYSTVREAEAREGQAKVIRLVSEGADLGSSGDPSGDSEGRKDDARPAASANRAS